MSPLDRRRRGRLSRRRAALAVGVVVAALALVIVVAGALRAPAESTAYRRAVNRSYAAQIRPIVSQSDALARQLHTMLGVMGHDTRTALQAALDTLVRTSRSLASQAGAAASPSPSGDAAGDVDRAMTERARGIENLRRAVDGVLAMSPLPVAGSADLSRASPTTAPARDLSAGAGTLLLERASHELASGDASYAAARRRLRSAPGEAHLPPSKWAGRIPPWTPASGLGLLDALLASPRLAPVRSVELVTDALVLTPAPVPVSVGAAASTSASTTTATATLPPTGRLRVTAVVANDGDVAERRIVVSATIAETGSTAATNTNTTTTTTTTATTTTTTTGRPVSRTVALGAHSSRALRLPTLRVVPGQSYTLTVAVTPPEASSVSAATSDTISLMVAPPSPPDVAELLPAKGRAAGGTKVTIVGSGFKWVSAVTFGGKQVRFTVDSSGDITAVSPPGNGTVTVRVQNPGGTSPQTSKDRFTYHRHA